jgi:hypothetical protein
MSATVGTYEHTPALEVEVEVTADKPGRYVRVQRPVAERNLMLGIQHREAGHDGVDHWTWLSPREARQLGEALIAASVPHPDTEGQPVEHTAHPLAGRLLALQLQQLELMCISARAAFGPLLGGVPEVRALMDRLGEVSEASRAVDGRLGAWKRQPAL